MRPSRSQMQPFARHWPRGRPSGTALLVATSLAAAFAQLCIVKLDRPDLGSELTLQRWFALQESSLLSGHAWQLLSFVLLHASAWQLGINLFILYFAGREVEPIVGFRHFVGLYATGNFLGGLGQWGAYALGLAPAGSQMLGVSAGVAAVLAAYATILPELDVMLLLFFVIPLRVRAKLLGVGLLIFSAFMMVLAGDSPIGPAGVLVGCFAGWAYAKQLGFGNPMAIERYLFDRRQHAARIERMPADQFIREEIDPILEKIAKSGAGSLSRSERRLLEKGRDKLAGKR